MGRPIDDFVAHLRNAGYHPRSNKHSNALGRVIVEDLLANCPLIATRGRTGQIVYKLNFDILAGTSEWNIDLVLGKPPSPAVPPATSPFIVEAAPATIEIAIELKAVMTEHRKAVKNRRRDLEAHYEHVHAHNWRAIAGGVLIINRSDRFQSPLRSAITEHRKPDDLLLHCVNELRSIRARTQINDVGVDARTALVVSMDNVNLRGTKLDDSPPAPQVGDPLHYASFIQRICDLYADRFA